MGEMTELYRAEFPGEPETTPEQHDDKDLAVTPQHIIYGRYDIVYHMNSLLFIIDLLYCPAILSEQGRGKRLYNPCLHKYLCFLNFQRTEKQA